MAILNADFVLWDTLAKQGHLPPEPRILEIGQANMSGQFQTYAESFGAARAYYKKRLGYKEIVAVDFHGLDCLRLDLNKPLALEGEFDIIINSGTTEHIFDQRQVFETIHDRCVVGGLMVHVAPWRGWNDHGFYNYQPTFFRDVARANDYETLYFKDWPCGEDVLMYVAMQKTRAEPFRVPIQGVYHHGDSLCEEHYQDKVLANHGRRCAMFECQCAKPMTNPHGMCCRCGGQVRLDAVGTNSVEKAKVQFHGCITTDYCTYIEGKCSCGFHARVDGSVEEARRAHLIATHDHYNQTCHEFKNIIDVYLAKGRVAVMERLKADDSENRFEPPPCVDSPETITVKATELRVVIGTLEIDLADGIFGTVKLNGQAISCRGFRIEYRACEPARIQLDIANPKG